MPENVDLNDFYRYASRIETASPQYRPPVSPSEGSPRNLGFENSFQSFSISETSASTSPPVSIFTQETSTIESRRLSTRSEANHSNPYRSLGHVETSTSVQFPGQSNATGQRNSTAVENLWLGSPSSERPKQQETTPVEKTGSVVSRLFKRRPVVSPGTLNPQPPTPIVSSSPSLTNAPISSPTDVGQRGAIVTGKPFKWELKYDLYLPMFKEFSGDLGVFPGEKAREVFGRSNLESSTLGMIWKYADDGNKGFLVELEFMVAMHLIRACLDGLKDKVFNTTDVQGLKTQLEQYTQSRIAQNKGIQALGLSKPKYDRARYEFECFDNLFPKAEEELEIIKKPKGFPPIQPEHRNRGGPLGLSALLGEDVPRNSLIVADFDDNDIDDDEDLVIHRIKYSRDQFFALLQQKKFGEAFQELNGSSLQTNFPYRFILMRAMIDNIAFGEIGTISSDIVLNGLAYSASEGVLANLLVYFNRALQNYCYGSGPSAINDCKRGLKLAKTAGITEKDRLETWAKSDLADLATLISLNSNARADAQYYQNIIQTDHESHSSIRRIKQDLQHMAKAHEPIGPSLLTYTPVPVAASGSPVSQYNGPPVRDVNLFEGFD
ncbi:hypothetical protein TWF694_001293 [Orbilia ellipsospora]|uniref:EH domain-containing protein n=1 Tax=Orbilia ellipsospora TaxID=2528407 RepID=A0AAV9XTR9_9PEZI